MVWSYLNVELDDYSFDSNQDYVSTLIKASASGYVSSVFQVGKKILKFFIV